MEGSNSPRAMKDWLKHKLNNNGGKRNDSSSPLQQRQSQRNSQSPQLKSGRSLEEDLGESPEHLPQKSTSGRTRPIRRSNTTGATPRASLAVVSRRQKQSRDSMDDVLNSQKKQSSIGSTQNFAGDLFVTEEDLMGLQRIRNFTTKDGSLVNRGDSFRFRKGSKSTKTENERDSSRHDPVQLESMMTRNLQTEKHLRKKELPKYNILVLGGSGVGKTTLINQMMTSVHLAADDTYGQHMAGYDCTSEVVVKVDQFEIVLRFLYTPETLQQLNEEIGTTAHNYSSDTTTRQQQLQHPDLELIKKNQSVASGYLVVYSVTDHSSFKHAQTCLNELRPNKRRNLVILVANKNDLVRNRVITEEDGMRLATHKLCKYIDLSALLDHKVDDLLVGIARQIHIRQTPLPPSRPPRPRVYFDEDGNPVSGEPEEDLSDDELDLYENRAHVAALQANQGMGTPRSNPKFAFLKPLFGQGQSKMRFNPGKFQSRVGSFVFGLFKKNNKDSDKSLSAAFSSQSYALAGLFPNALDYLKTRCDDLMSP